MIKYFTPEHTEKEKQIYVSTVGYEEIGPGEEYPSHHHPAGYYFDPSVGRVIDEYQIVYFVAGEGSLKLKDGCFTIAPGSVLMLPPGTWHSYFPNPATGWKQYWICFKGKFVDEWLREPAGSSGSPLLRVGLNPEILGLFHKAVEIAGPGTDINLIGGLIIYLVNTVCNFPPAEKEDETASDNESKIAGACLLMQNSLDKEIKIEDIATAVGLSYPLFRKLFRKQMKMSASSYLLQLRMSKGAEMLMCTSEPVKNVAYSLGYDQPAYFTYCFHKVMGMTPQEYRDRNRR